MHTNVSLSFGVINDVLFLGILKPHYMKKLFGTVLLLLLSFGCENEGKLTFEPLEMQGEACSGCPKIEIQIPRALDDLAVSEAINRGMEEEVISLLSFDGGEEIDTAEKAMSSFTDSYKELKAKFPDEIRWEAKISAKVIHEDENIVSIQLDSYTYTGGAHGYGATTFLNFDKRKGTELENWELFEDPEGFQKFAETKFRIQENIPQDQNINATGFMFEGDSFHLANNIGYTEDGIQLVYNQYEVASFADGPIVLTLPYAEVNQYLKRKVKS